jgi:hypothetical protein
MTKRINLWSGPRNISTAMMYAFAQRSDTQVFDEPLYAHYLSKSDGAAQHPGVAEVLASMEQDGAVVLQELLRFEARPIAFFKQMAHHWIDLDGDFLASCQNVLLTRTPAEMLLSYSEQIETPTLEGVGYAALLEIAEYLRERELPFIVLDSKTVLQQPENALRRLCQFLDIPFDAAMLGWEAGARPEDGVWAKYWYKNVHLSTGFAPYRPKEQPFPEHLQPLLALCEPLYAALLEMSEKF